MAIHPTAIIDRRAEIDPSVEIGPYVVIDGPVKIAAGCRVMAQSYLNGRTEIGPDCVIHPFAVLGHLPQDLTWKETDTGLKVGRGNVFREGCSIHRATRPGASTLIGDYNYLMGYSHVGHDGVVGNRVIMANGALLAGHVTVQDGAFISGDVAVHQFVRIGRLVMLGGQARVGKDVPPFMLLEGDSNIRGINVVGLRRAGFTAEQRSRVKSVFSLLYRSGLNVTQALAEIEKAGLDPEGAEIVSFIKSSRRGICSHWKIRRL
jgi:UDP-N-acetylglucosamine acyltransferase